MGKAESENCFPVDSRNDQKVFMEQLAAECSNFLSNYTAGNVQSEIKPGLWHDLVTEVDRGMDARLRELILTKYPDDGIISEEDNAVQGSNDRQWYIDPIDGTTNFVRGIPGWVVSVACEDSKGLKSAMIYDPTLNETYSAVRGQGTTMNLSPIQGAQVSDDFSSVVYAGHFGYDYKREETGRRGRLIQNISFGHRSFGGAAVSLAYTAAGRVDATYFECPIQDWDVKAGIMLCREAGLKAEIVDPAPNGEHRRIIAAPENLFEEIIRISDAS
jgi:myo-inositol-1(or 4)-monophosphatase